MIKYRKSERERERERKRDNKKKMVHLGTKKLNLAQVNFPTDAKKEKLKSL
jgi:hypothetical protein